MCCNSACWLLVLSAGLCPRARAANSWTPPSTVTGPRNQDVVQWAPPADPVAAGAALPSYVASTGVPSADALGNATFVDEDPQPSQVGGTLTWSFAAEAGLPHAVCWAVFLAEDALGTEKVLVGEVPVGSTELNIPLGTSSGTRSFLLVYGKNPYGLSATAGVARFSDLDSFTVARALAEARTTATATITTATMTTTGSPFLITNLQFTDTNDEALQIGGSVVTWTPPVNTSLVMSYWVYIAADTEGTAKAALWHQYPDGPLEGDLLERLPVGTNQMNIYDNTKRQTMNDTLPANWLLVLWQGHDQGYYQPIEDAAKLPLYDLSDRTPSKVDLLINESLLQRDETFQLSGTLQWAVPLGSDAGFTTNFSVYMAPDMSGTGMDHLGDVPVGTSALELPGDLGCGGGMLAIYARNPNGRAADPVWHELETCITTTLTSTTTSTASTSTLTTISVTVSTTTTSTTTASTTTTTTWTDSTTTSTTSTATGTTVTGTTQTSSLTTTSFTVSTTTHSSTTTSISTSTRTTTTSSNTTTVSTTTPTTTTSISSSSTTTSTDTTTSTTSTNSTTTTRTSTTTTVSSTSSTTTTSSTTASSTSSSTVSSTTSSRTTSTTGTNTTTFTSSSSTTTTGTSSTTTTATNTTTSTTTSTPTTTTISNTTTTTTTTTSTVTTATWTTATATTTSTTTTTASSTTASSTTASTTTASNTTTTATSSSTSSTSVTTSTSSTMTATSATTTATTVTSITATLTTTTNTTSTSSTTTTGSTTFTTSTTTTATTSITNTTTSSTTSWTTTTTATRTTRTATRTATTSSSTNSSTTSSTTTSLTTVSTSRSTTTTSVSTSSTSNTSTTTSTGSSSTTSTATTATSTGTSVSTTTSLTSTTNTTVTFSSTTTTWDPGLCVPFAELCHKRMPNGDTCVEACEGDLVALNNLTCTYDTQGVGHMPSLPDGCVKPNGSIKSETYVFGILIIGIKAYINTLTEGDFRRALAAATGAEVTAVFRANAVEFPGAAPTRLLQWSPPRWLGAQPRQLQGFGLDGALERHFTLDYILLATAAGPSAKTLQQRAKAIAFSGTEEQSRFKEELEGQRSLVLVSLQELHAPLELVHRSVATPGTAGGPVPLDDNGSQGWVMAVAGLSGAVLGAMCCGLIVLLHLRSRARKAKARPHLATIKEESCHFEGQEFNKIVPSLADEPEEEGQPEPAPEPPHPPTPVVGGLKRESTFSNKKVRFSGVEYAPDGGTSMVVDCPEPMRASPVPILGLGSLPTRGRGQALGREAGNAAANGFPRDFLPEDPEALRPWTTPSPASMTVGEGVWQHKQEEEDLELVEVPLVIRASPVPGCCIQPPLEQKGPVPVARACTAELEGMDLLLDEEEEDEEGLGTHEPKPSMLQEEQADSLAFGGLSPTSRQKRASSKSLFFGRAASLLRSSGPAG